MQIIFSKAAEKALLGLDRPTKERLRIALMGIPQGDIVPLKGVEGTFRLRVGG